jgi:hypothetical protein
MHEYEVMLVALTPETWYVTRTVVLEIVMPAKMKDCHEETVLVALVVAATPA